MSKRICSKIDNILQNDLQYITSVGETVHEEPVHDSPHRYSAQNYKCIGLPEKTLEIVGAELRRQNALISAEEALADCRYILLFFAQNNHMNTKASVEILKNFYESVNQAGCARLVEVIFVSMSDDRKVQNFYGTYRHMPWLAVPFEDRDQRFNMMKWFKAVPSGGCFTLIDRNGDVSTRKGDPVEQKAIDALIERLRDDTLSKNPEASAIL